MRRREFIRIIAGSAAAVLPLATLAQQVERMRLIGALVAAGTEMDDLDTQTRIGAFRQGLQQLGWVDGKNVRIDVRAGGGDADRIRRYAEELVALACKMACPLYPRKRTCAVQLCAKSRH